MQLKTTQPRIVPPLFFSTSLAAVIFLLLLLSGCSGGDNGENGLATDQTQPPADDVSDEIEFPLTYEAENGNNSGVVIEDQYSDFSGTGYVAQFNEVGDFIEFPISIPRQDFYTLRFRFLNGDQTPAVLTLLLDGVEVPGKTAFKTVYDQTTPAGIGAWASVDESLRMDAGDHTIRLLFMDENDRGDVLIDFMQVLDETSPSTTSTRSLIMNNWTDLIGIHYSSHLNPGYAYARNQGPRLASLHWAGNWSRSQIESAAAFFRDETSETAYTNINEFESNLYFTDDGILNVDYLNYGDEVLPVAIRKQYAMVPNEPFLIVRYTLTNRSSESRDFNLMELVDLSPPGGDASLQADWYPDLNAWIADTGEGAFLVFGAFSDPDSHASERPDGIDSGLIAEFGGQGSLENTDSFSAEDVSMAMTHRMSIGSGEEQERAFFYSVQPSRQEAEAVAGRIRGAVGPESWFEQTRTAWQEWLDSGRSTVDSGDPGVNKAYTRNLIVLRQCQQPEFGSFVASTNPIYFHKVWPRDGSVSAMSLDAAGYHEQAEKFWLWMAEVQEEGPGDIEGKTFVEDFPNGTWYTNYSFWALDEPIDFVQPEWDAVGQFLIGVYHHWRLLNEEDSERAGQFLDEIYPAVVDSAEWISDNVNPEAEDEFGFGPPGFSVWEEDFEYATYTQVTYASGLNGARLLAEERGETDRAQQWLDDARTIRDNLLDPVDSEPCGGMWDSEEGYFIRGIYAPAGTDSGQCEPDRRMDASSDLLWVFGLLPADDPKAQSHRQKVLDVLTPPYPTAEIPEDAPVQEMPDEWLFGLGISRYDGDAFYYSSDFSPGGKFESTVPMPTWPWMSSYMSMAEHWLDMDDLSFARLQWYVSVSGAEYMPTGEGVDWYTQQPLPSTMSQPDDAGYNVQIALLNYLGLYDPRLPPLEETPDDTPSDDDGGSDAPVDGGSGTPVDDGSSDLSDSAFSSAQAE